MQYYYTYILANKRNGTLYIGVTSNLIQRIWQHKQSLDKSFTNKYNVKKLVYYEQHTDIECAILHEKKIKRWSRKWKLELIEELNPNWNDLYDEII